MRLLLPVCLQLFDFHSLIFQEEEQDPGVPPVMAIYVQIPLLLVFSVVIIVRLVR